MESAKKQRLSVNRLKTRRDSGLYSDSGPSEAEVPLKYHEENISDMENIKSDLEKEEIIQQSRNKCSASNEDRVWETRTRENKRDNAYSYHDTVHLKDDESETQKHDAKPKYETSGFSFTNEKDEAVGSRLSITSHAYESINSVRNPSMVSTKTIKGQGKSFLNQADAAVINRCDDLIHQLQDSTQKYQNLAHSYRKNKRLFITLAAVNVVLIVCVLICLPLLMINARNGQSPDPYGPISSSDNLQKADKQYRICFNCSDVKRDPTFSLETLVEVLQIDGKCCFKSILSVLKSQNRHFENLLDVSTTTVRNRMSAIDKRLLEIEIGSAPDTHAIIGKMLQILAPKEKTTVHLRTERGIPYVKDFDSFNKIRWSPSESTAILRGHANLSDEGLSIIVKAEAYYFIYTKIQFRKKERSPYDQNLPLSYLVYRKRGSIPSYVHEAKLNCIFNDKTQEHSISSEMILHLNREDEIFISVDDSDKTFLSTDPGAHMIGLFEI